MGDIKGFTLIELMIAVAIVSILASIALTQYQNYMVKTQIITAIAELNGAKSQYELVFNGASVSNMTAYSVSNMFLSPTSKFCHYTVYAPVGLDAVPALECVMQNVSPVLLGKSIYLNRSADGYWSCEIDSTISTKYKPNQCI